MTSFRLPLLSSVFAFLLFASAALSLPSPSTNPSSLELINEDDLAPAHHVQNLTFKKWPAQPYTLSLRSRSGSPHLVIAFVRAFQGASPVSVSVLQDFLHDFRDNLAREYPVPGYIPHMARQTFFDLGSSTRWSIEMTEGLLGKRGPTEWALLALDKVAAQLVAYGPAELFFGIQDKESILPYMNALLLVETVGDLPLGSSSGNRTGTLQTS